MNAMRNQSESSPQSHILFTGSLLLQQRIPKPSSFSSSTKAFVLLTHPEMQNSAITKWKHLLERQGSPVIVLSVT